MIDKMSEEQIYEEAKKRVEEKKGFRTHAIVYAVINAFLALTWWLTGGGFPWFVFPLAGWGIGLLFHGLGVYVLSGRQEGRQAIEREAEKIRRSESRYPVEEGEKAQQEELEEEEEEAKREKEEETEEAKREKEEEAEEAKKEKEEEEEEAKREKEEEAEEAKREKEEEEEEEEEEARKNKSEQKP
jgi:flagellar biosynthesis GTPase FlhF